MRFAPLAFVLILGAAAFAGCVAPATEGEVSPAAADIDAVGRARTMFLAGDGTMADAPNAALAPLAWGWPQWLDGTLAPAWYSAPAEAAYIVDAATITVVYEALWPTTSFGVRPELTIWFGVEDSIIEHGFQPGDSPLLPGQQTTGVFEVGIPRGGLVVAAGERLVLRIGTYYADTAGLAAIAAVLGEGATRIDLTTRGVDLPAAAMRETLEGTVQLIGGRCVALDAATEDGLIWVPFDPVRTDATLIGIDVAAARGAGQGPPDIDLILLDPLGEVAGHAAGSGGEEALHLHMPNLELAPPDGEWRFGIYACTPMRATAAWTITLRYA